MATPANGVEKVGGPGAQREGLYCPGGAPARLERSRSPFTALLQVGVLIVGAGPTGLGAATRLHQLGHPSWLLCDAVRAPPRRPARQLAARPPAPAPSFLLLLGRPAAHAAAAPARLPGAHAAAAAAHLCEGRRRQMRAGWRAPT